MLAKTFIRALALVAAFAFVSVGSASASCPGGDGPQEPTTFCPGGDGPQEPTTFCPGGDGPQEPTT